MAHCGYRAEHFCLPHKLCFIAGARSRPCGLDSSVFVRIAAAIAAICLLRPVLAGNLDIVAAARKHRRIPNLMTYFERTGYVTPITQAASDYLPGDIVAWELGGGILHVGIVSDRDSATHVPLVINNIGAGVREEDILFRFGIIGHYRLPAS